MKKTVLSALAGLMIVGSATALPTPEDRKKACEQDPEKVWVEKTKACIPVKPCADDDKKIRETYCMDLFGRLEESAMQNEDVRDKLLKKALGAYNINRVEYGFDDCVLEESWQLGGLFCEEHPVLFVNYDDMYVEVPYNKRDGAFLTASGAACLLYGGVFMRGNYEEPGRMACTGIESANVCKDLSGFVSGLIGKTMKYTWRDKESPSLCWVEGTNGTVDDAEWGG